MTPSNRSWLQEARRDIRSALLYAERHDWNTCVSTVASIWRRLSDTSEVTIEVKNMLASLAVTDPSELKKSAAMRAAAVRRLEEVKSFIGESLVATTDR